MKYTDWNISGTRIVGGSVAILLLAGVVFVYGVLRFPEPSIEPEKKGDSAEWPLDFYELRCERVARDVESGVLTPSVSGVLGLSPEAAELSRDGVAYVTWLGPEDVRILFVTWRSEFALGGYLYCTRPLEKKDLCIGSKDTPRVGAIGPVRGIKGTADFELDIELEMNPNWYLVETGYD